MNIKSLTRYTVAISALCTLLGAPTMAQAAFYFQGDGYAQGAETFTLTAPVTIAINPVGAGGFSGHVGPTSPPTMPIFFWCVELSQTFSFGTIYSDYSVGAYSNTLLSQLFTEVGGSGAILTGAPSEARTDLSAAFQLAVWEIMFEGGTYGGLDVTSGNFKATNGDPTDDAILQANAWLSALTAASPATTLLYLIQNANHQDFVTDTPIPPGLLVPEPAPLTLLGVGILALMITMRRRA
jgi:hypothetical protein